MLRQLFSATRSIPSIGSMASSSWHLPLQRNIFLSQPKNYQRFFSKTSAKYDFKKDFAKFLDENLVKDNKEIKDENLRVELRSLYQSLVKEMQKNHEEQLPYVKIIHKNMSDEIKSSEIVSAPIRQFSNAAMNVLLKQVDDQGYATCVSCLSVGDGWINTKNVLSFCKKIPGITDKQELLRIPLTREQVTTGFTK